MSDITLLMVVLLAPLTIGFIILPVRSRMGRFTESPARRREEPVGLKRDQPPMITASIKQKVCP